MKIQYIKHAEIEFAKWDIAVERSTTPLIYAYSWYLDGIANAQWDALVYGDYEAVFPLPWKRKYGLKYIYQPYFCQQLGLFARSDFKFATIDFIKAIPKSFVLIDMQVNGFHGGLKSGVKRKNYQLDLNQPYTILREGYISDVAKNLRKIERVDVQYDWNIPFDTVVKINRAAWGELNPTITHNDYDRLAQNCRIALEKNCLVTLGARKGEEIIGAVLLFKTPYYLFYVSGGATEEGKKCGVMNGLIDTVIKAYAGKPMVLDFEGSEIEGVAYFYSKFGSKIVPYLHYKKFNIF